MSDKIDRKALDPLWLVADSDPDPNIRIAALEAASRFKLTTESWKDCAYLTKHLIELEPVGSTARRSALRLAARIPLLSLRRDLREMTWTLEEADRAIITTALDEVGDQSRIRPLLEKARSDHGRSFQQLAAMPVEDEGIVVDDIPPLPEDPVPNAAFWRALLLARLGDFGELDELFEEGAREPELFWGSQGTAYDAIAVIQPIPEPMREHLLAALKRSEDSARQRMVQLIVWAATGIADAEGSPIEASTVSEPRTTSSAPSPSNEDVTQALLTAEHLFLEGLHVGEINVERQPPSDRVSELVKRIVIKANKRAGTLPKHAPANMLLGNKIIEVIPNIALSSDWPVAELALEQMKAERPALDDDQMAWIIARDRPDRMIFKVLEIMEPERPATERVRLLNLLGSAADHQAGRGGSPFRGAGPGGGGSQSGRRELIDDTIHKMATAAPPADTPEPEQRRVHAQIRSNNKRRRTFVAGADNVIRCWIGLPEPEQGAFASEQIPRVDIPEEGLPLSAELCWGDQSDRKDLVLPAERSARTRDCDLHLNVPVGERFISAEIVFRFRGRAFEVVQVEAEALAPGEPEQSNHRVNVRVQVSRREVIEAPKSRQYDAMMMYGADRSRPKSEQESPSLRVFGGQGPQRYDLKDSEAAIEWLNEELAVAQKILVRSLEASPGADEVLDAKDPEALAFLRDMARHGANLYNQLMEQGFTDPGERIELLSLDTTTYVPLEFVYDRGYPIDDATLCDGWKLALLPEARECPTCRAIKITDDNRHRMPVICPLGFWSLQKIIERLDSTGEKDNEGATQFGAPRPERRNLPVLDRVVFGISHNVDAKDRADTWAFLQKSFKEPKLADDWDQWLEAVQEEHPPLLLALPHHDEKAALDYLQIGADDLPSGRGQLSRAQLTKQYVNPHGQEPGPIVMLLGCRTGARVGIGFGPLACRFQRLQASVVLCTLTEVLGRHAAPLARELVHQMVEVKDAETDFGTIMRRVRRQMLAKGYLMALSVVALGDAEWRLTPRPDSVTPN